MSRTYTMVIMGAAGVGKSALTIRFFQQKFVDEYDPTIEENYRKQFEIDHEMSMLDVMDTAGAEEYEQMRNAYIAKGEGFIIVYSITNKSSFDQVMAFYQQVITVKGTAEITPVVIVGNKCDLESDRKVDEEVAQQLAISIHSPIFESSAKEGVNVNEPFFEVVRMIRRYKPVYDLKKKKKSCAIM